MIWSWYTGRWRVGCYTWYNEEGTGRGPSSLYQQPTHQRPVYQLSWYSLLAVDGQSYLFLLIPWCHCDVGRSLLFHKIFNPWYVLIEWSMWLQFTVHKWCKKSWQMCSSNKCAISHTNHHWIPAFYRRKQSNWPLFGASCTVSFLLKICQRPMILHEKCWWCTSHVHHWHFSCRIT